MGLITTLHEAARTGIPEQTLSFRLVVAFTVCGSDNRTDEAAHKTPFLPPYPFILQDRHVFCTETGVLLSSKTFTCILGPCVLVMLAVAYSCNLWYELMLQSKLLF